MRKYRVVAAIALLAACAVASWPQDAPVLDAAEPSSHGLRTKPADARPSAGASLDKPRDLSSIGSLASLEEMLEEARSIDPSEREERLDELDRVLDEEGWVERANADQLSESERLTMRALLRERNALAIARAEELLAAVAPAREAP
jgi:hypothetical protein